MRRNGDRACRDNTGGIKRIGTGVNSRCFSCSYKASNLYRVTGKESACDVSCRVGQSLRANPGDCTHLVCSPAPRLPASPRPSSERLHLWKKVMKVHQDRQLRICTHAQAQIQCRYAYLPKIGRHQNQTRSAGRSSPPVVDLYRQTHLARSELLRTPRHTSIYQGQFYP